MTLLLALRSLRNRRATAVLTIAAIAISVTLLLGVEKLRTAARDGFANTVSGVDLIVGARSGQLNLLLYSVFRVGDATANVTWESYQRIAKHPDVAWTIPAFLRGFAPRLSRTRNDNGFTLSIIVLRVIGRLCLPKDASLMIFMMRSLAPMSQNSSLIRWAARCHRAWYGARQFYRTWR